VGLLRVRNQRQVAVVAAIEFRGGIPAHDALQQHPSSQLQTTAFEKALSRHDLAPWHAVKVWRDTFNFINAHQSLRE
jgi:hypothetical protein